MVCRNLSTNKTVAYVRCLVSAADKFILFYLFAIYLSLTNFVSSYNQTSLPQTARVVSNIQCDQQHCGMLLSLTPDI